MGATGMTDDEHERRERLADRIGLAIFVAVCLGIVVLLAMGFRV